MEWAGKTGFINDWYLCGPFESGLEKNPNPDLFDLKNSLYWEKDEFTSIGGVEHVFEKVDLGKYKLECDWQWEYAPCLFYPELQLSSLKEYFPDWESKLKDVNTSQWTKKYYALSLIESSADMDVTLKFCGWDGCRLWVNGKLSFEDHSFHHSIYEKESLTIQLKKGVNRFLFQLDRDGVVARIDVGEDSKSSVDELKSICLSEMPEERTVSTFHQIRTYSSRLKVSDSFKNDGNETFQNWQNRMRDYYHTCLGPYLKIEEGFGDFELVKSHEYEKYIENYYHIKTENNNILPCYVLIPKPEFFNGRTILYPHGHASRFAHLIGKNIPPPGPKMWLGEYTGNFAQVMAEKGYVTAIFCERGFEDRKDHFSNVDACNKAHRMLMAMGLRLPRLHLGDIHLLYDLLVSLDQVDRNRIGISGLSGGATLSYLAGAYDERFKAMAVYCGTCSYYDYSFEGGCGLQVVDGWFPKGDTSDFFSLIAPRAVLIAQGKLDSTFNVVRTKQIYDQASKNYQIAGSPDKIQYVDYDLAHEYNVEIADNFFSKEL